MKSTDEWMNLIPSDVQKSFIKFVPDLTKTPDLKVTCPPDCDKFTQRFDSEEWRIRSSSKMNELHELRDQVFRSILEPLSWSLSQCIELPHLSQQNDSENCDDMNENEDESQQEHYDYHTNIFVAMRPCDAKRGFWLAKILNIERNSSREVPLQVHWYEPVQHIDPIDAKYRPSFIIHRRGAQPWKDMISDNSVIVSFDSLTRSNNIPMQVRKAIQSSLS